MKRINNIYNELIDIKLIFDIYTSQVRRNTKNKNKIEKFEDYLSSNIINVYNILKNKNYKNIKYNIFLIKEPKYRIVMSLNIGDKLLNHLVGNLLIKYLDKSLIDENIATRKDKGTHYGLRLLSNYLNIMKEKYNNFYILKCDIKKFFYNIDHNILKEKLSKKIKDKDLLNIINIIINSTNNEYINKKIKNIIEKEISKTSNNDRIKGFKNIPLYLRDKGLPIGNMTSQFFAIFYLNDLDHYIKEVLKIKYYIRYMDDFILIHHDKNYLRYCLKIIEKMLKEENKLELNHKTNIINIKNGIDFLGFHFYIKNNKIIKKIRLQTKKKFKKKVKKLTCLYNNKIFNIKEFKQVLASYDGHLKYGNTYCLKNYIYKKIKEILF